MRWTLILFGLMLVASPTFGQKAANQPTLAVRVAEAAEEPAESQAASLNQDTDQRLEKQVSAIQQRLQHEERRLQAQFAELAKMRTPAVAKADQATLERIAQLEQQVVAAYQKRVEQILSGGEAKIPAQAAAASPSQSQQHKRQVQKSQQPQPPASVRTEPPKRPVLPFWPFNQF
ncbi:MAG: hypothetical protein GXY25_06730 [Pirellulaceae bacterium]|jgi:hypothetical protein|nr:hypothetical protein [Thermoguttaceae bacterium]MDI9445335.1 hypothetical protein [Planctomycetota bacterium]NLZ00214.1 hypothetical protein [Pirellulaceae bacterium]